MAWELNERQAFCQAPIASPFNDVYGTTSFGSYGPASGAPGIAQVTENRVLIAHTVCDQGNYPAAGYAISGRMQFYLCEIGVDGVITTIDTLNIPPPHGADAEGYEGFEQSWGEMHAIGDGGFVMIEGVYTYKNEGGSTDLEIFVTDYLDAKPTALWKFPSTTMIGVVDVSGDTISLRWTKTFGHFDTNVGGNWGGMDMRYGGYHRLSVPDNALICHYPAGDTAAEPNNYHRAVLTFNLANGNLDSYVVQTDTIHPWQSGGSIRSLAMPDENRIVALLDPNVSRVDGSYCVYNFDTGESIERVTVPLATWEAEDWDALEGFNYLGYDGSSANRGNQWVGSAYSHYPTSVETDPIENTLVRRAGFTWDGTRLSGPEWQTVGGAGTTGLTVGASFWPSEERKWYLTTTNYWTDDDDGDGPIVWSDTLQRWCMVWPVDNNGEWLFTLQNQNAPEDATYPHYAGPTCFWPGGSDTYSVHPQPSHITEWKMYDPWMIKAAAMPFGIVVTYWGYTEVGYDQPENLSYQLFAQFYPNPPDDPDIAGSGEGDRPHFLGMF